ncbi:MAG: HAD family hydrolase [Candidatus Nanohaloarchaea archaeon]
MPLEAIIFDMDGVISRTQELHAQAQSEVLDDYDVDMNQEEITEKYAGKPPGTLFEQETNASDPMEAYARKQERLFKLVQERGVEPVEGALNLIRDAYSEGYSMAVASSSEPDFIRDVLEELELLEHFDAVVSAEEVEEGKPSPDVFLEAARMLEVAPTDCLVIEDGQAGMKGAREAGMLVLGLTDNGGEYAHYTVSSLAGVDAQQLESLHSDLRD